jgi:hypothetical protein
MKAYKEITEWDSDFAVPNHVYFLNDGKDKMYGYVRESDGVVQLMKTPYRFHVRGRKFKEVPNTWNFGADETPEPMRGKEYKVLGSRGSIYIVTDEGGAWSCTCPAAKWQKGECKHIKSLKSNP